MKKKILYLEILCVILSVGIMHTGCSKSDNQPEKQMPTLKAASSYVAESKSGYTNYYYYNTNTNNEVQLSFIIINSVDLAYIAKQD